MSAITERIAATFDWLSGLPPAVATAVTVTLASALLYDPILNGNRMATPSEIEAAVAAFSDRDECGKAAVALLAERLEATPAGRQYLRDLERDTERCRARAAQLEALNNAIDSIAPPAAAALPAGI